MSTDPGNSPAPVGRSDALNASTGLPDLGRRLVQGASASLIGQVFEVLLMGGAVMVLARLLTPEDFGLMAMAMTVISLSEVVRDLGLPASVVYQRRVNQAQIDTLFWVNLGFGGILCLVVAASGPVVAWVYGDPRLVTLLPVLSLSLLCYGSGVQYEAVLKRQMRFGAVAAGSALATGAGVTVSIGLAVGGAGHWALASHVLAEAFVSAAWMWSAGGWRPGAPKYGTGLWPALRYAADVLAYRVVTYLGKNLDQILISIFAGPTSVGLYSLADRWASMPQRLTYGRLASVALSGFSRVRDDPARYAAYYRRSMCLLWTAMFPVLGGVALTADSVIGVLAGPQWSEAVPLLRWLAVGVLALCVSLPSRWTLMAEGRTRNLLIFGIVSSLITAGSLSLGVMWGARGVATAFAVVTLTMAPITVAFWVYGSPLTWADVGAAIARPLGALLAMAAAWTILPQWPGPPIVDLALSVAVLAPVYMVTWAGLPGGTSAVRELRDALRTLAGTSGESEES